MDLNIITQPLFQLKFLLPHYWGIWLCYILLWLSSYLPIPLQLWLGKYIGRILKLLSPYRANIVRRNLELCFPDHEKSVREHLLRLNFEEVGKALFDISNAWHWSNNTVQNNMDIHGVEHIRAIEKQGCGVILLAVHSLALEMGARVSAQIKSGIGVYRPHNNLLLEYLQVRGRMRSAEALIPKSNPRDIIKALRSGKFVWYTADQAPARDTAVFVPLFSVPDVATVSSTSKLAKLGNAKVCQLYVERKQQGGYFVEISAPLDNFPSDSVVEDTKRLNTLIEKMITRKPEQYLWMHRRFKVHQDPDAPSYYA